MTVSNHDGVAAEEKMRTMLQTQSYNVTMIPPLEEYITFMCRGTVPYMFQAVRTLIKLYTLFPYSPLNSTGSSSTESASTSKNKILDHMGLCCLLALTYGSSSSDNQQDILALRYMIPMTHIPKDHVNLLSQVFHCATLLDNSMFVDFWTSYHASFLPESTIKSGLPITELDIMIRSVATTAISILQTSILTILAITYRQAPIDIVYASLNITNSDDWKEVMQRNSTIVEPNPVETAIVHFVPSRHNTQRHCTYQESIHFTNTLASLRQ